MNPVLTRLVDERAHQVDFIDQLLARVESESRDLVDAERSNLQAARQRISEIDTQRTPLEEFEALREISAESTRLAYAGAATRSGSSSSDGAPAGPASDRRGAGYTTPRAHEYRSAGEFVVDYLRARALPITQLQGADTAAAARVSSSLGRDIFATHADPTGQAARALAVMTTDDIPGLLPKAIVGPILSDLDASRPFVQSIGVRPLTAPGKTFSRPFISQHTQVGKQTAEKTELPSRELKVDEVDFTKETFGGAVNISRQTIDWSDPSAWDALLTDLTNVYGADTDDAAAQAFAAAVTQTVPVAASTIDGYIDALYAAAALAVSGGAGGRASALRLPNCIWTSVDAWAQLGAALAKARPTAQNPAGASSPTSFAGDLLSIPRIMVPGFPDGTIIVGRKDRTEFYEERIGILSAIEPRILGVEVAYGGYAAYGTLDPTAFAKLEVDAAGGTRVAAAAGATPADAAVTVSGSTPGA